MPSVRSVLLRMPPFEQFDKVGESRSSKLQDVNIFTVAQEESAERHDLFKDALQRSNDKFGTISEFFGRGVMSTPAIDRP